MSKPALLSDDDLVLLGRIQNGVLRIKDAIDRVNELVVQSGLSIRQIQKVDAALTGNDVYLLLVEHYRAVDEMRAEAMERLAA